jgi:CBS domain-containing protein
LKGALLDRSSERLGRVEDLVVRLREDERYPPVSGLQASIGGRELFVPIDFVASLEPGAISLSKEKLHLGRFERRAGELLLARDLLDRNLINLIRPRLVHARDIELANLDRMWRVVGVDTSIYGLLRRFLPGKLAAKVSPRPFLDWASVEPFVSHVPTAKLTVPHKTIALLHPAQIADLVEAASHSEGEEIIKTVGQDRELEADVFEELDREHQLEFLRERADSQAAQVLSNMAPDDAADLIANLEQERRASVLSLLPASQQRKVRNLLGYNPSSAGGLMNPDFVSLASTASVSEALAQVRHTDVPPEAAVTVYTTDETGRLDGAVLSVELLRSSESSPLAEVTVKNPARLHATADVVEVAQQMTDFNLAVAPVVDDNDQLIGVVTCDDLLEAVLPPTWRWRAGKARDS